MINKDEELSFITDEEGKDIPIQVLKEFDSEDGEKRFVIYTDLSDLPLEEKEFLVARIITNDDGSLELADVESEEDMEYCEEVFDSLIDELLSEDLSNEEEEEEVVQA